MEKRILCAFLLTGFVSAGFPQTAQKSEQAEDVVYTYHISSTLSLDNADFNALAVTEFGAGSSLADWTNLKAWMAGLPDGMNSFYSVTGTPVAGICYLQRNGIRYWGGRHFFIQQFNSGPPGGFAQYDHYLTIYLGTWNGMNIQYMAMVPEGTVPVNMSSFTALQTSEGIRLNWTTESEQNNLGFKLTRSAGGSVFETIGFINGNGTTTEPKSYSYFDRSPVTCHTSPVIYRLFQVDQDGTVHSAGRTEAIFNNPEIELFPAYPNPFNPETTIGFAIPGQGTVSLKLYDVLGKETGLLLNESLSAGYHSFILTSSTLASGVYFVRMEFNGKSVTRQITVLR